MTKITSLLEHYYFKIIFLFQKLWEIKKNDEEEDKKINNEHKSRSQRNKRKPWIGLLKIFKRQEDSKKTN